MKRPIPFQLSKRNFLSVGLCVLVAAGLIISGALAEEVESAPPEAEGDWLENYYRTPDPGQFVEQFTSWSRDGVLENDRAKAVVVAFSSQVIRQNRTSLKKWYQQVESLPQEHLQLFQTAMLYSRTSEADEILRAKYGQAYDEQRTETSKILEMPLDKENTFDMLWGFFYATGSEQAIRRIVTCFVFIHAPEVPDGVDVPEGHMAYYKILPRYAYEALISNGERHPKVLEILEAVQEKPQDLKPGEREGLYDVLSVLNPKKYPPTNSA